MAKAFESVTNTPPDDGPNAEGRRLFEREAVPFFDSLYVAALSLTRNEADAQDLLQEAMLRAFRKFHLYEPGTNLKAWLYRILVNQFISDYRRSKRAPDRITLDDAGEPEGTSLEGVMNERVAYLELGDTLALENFKEQLSDRIKAAVEQLPESFRIILILSVVNGLTYREISEALDIPMGTAMSRLGRAKAMIRDRLNGAMEKRS